MNEIKKAIIKAIINCNDNKMLIAIYSLITNVLSK